MGCADLKILLKMLKSLFNDKFLVFGNVCQGKAGNFHELFGRLGQQLEKIIVA